VSDGAGVEGIATGVGPTDGGGAGIDEAVLGAGVVLDGAAFVIVIVFPFPSTIVEGGVDPFGATTVMLLLLPETSTSTPSNPPEEVLVLESAAAVVEGAATDEDAPELEDEVALRLNEPTAAVEALEGAGMTGRVSSWARAVPVARIENMSKASEALLGVSIDPVLR
jgi:hypothetical protein